MRKLIIGMVFLMSCSLAHAQQYGWVRVAQPGNQQLFAVEFADSLHGWAARVSTDIFRTVDGGTNWTPVAASPFIVSSISMVDTGYGWCVGTQGSTPGRIVRTTNGGTSWSEQLVANGRFLNGTFAQTKQRNSTSGTVGFPGDTGKVIQTTSGGAVWSERTIADSITHLTKVEFVDSLHGWIVGSGPHGTYLLHTVDGGLTWVILNAPSRFGGISFIDTLTGWGIGGFNVDIHKTMDGGITWQYRSSIRTPDDELEPVGISFVDSLIGWIFGTIFYQGDLAGAIYRTTDGGYSWTRESVAQLRQIRSGLMLDRYHGWAVGQNGVLRYQVVTSVAERLPGLPKTTALHQNYPNPFNPITDIEYELVERSHVLLVVYDINGKEVQQLINVEQGPGVYRVRFDGSALASGVYYYPLTAGTYKVTRQMILLK